MPDEQCHSGIAHGYPGAVQELLDHPAITGILAELLSEPHYDREESYPFRCEGSFVTVRRAGRKKEDLGGTSFLSPLDRGYSTVAMWSRFTRSQSIG